MLFALIRCKTLTFLNVDHSKTSQIVSIACRDRPIIDPVKEALKVLNYFKACARLAGHRITVGNPGENWMVDIGTAARRFLPTEFVATRKKLMDTADEWMRATRSRLEELDESPFGSYIRDDSENIGQDMLML